MKKLIISAVVGLALIGGVASAQAGCASISSTLSLGSRGSQVSALQQFLVSQNYPGGGSWMVTGYYGQATAAAVRIFQQQHGLSQSGIVDYATLAALQSCSGGSSGYVSGTYSYPGYPGYTAYPYGTTYPNNYSYPSNYTYGNGYPYNYSNNGIPVITSLSQNTGTAGQSVTIYGQGFDPYNNTINFGNQIVPGVASSNGTSLTFTIPYTYSYSANQTIQLSVSDYSGTSNTVTFTLNPNVWNTCGTNGYPYNYGYNNTCGTCGGYTYGYNNCQGNTSSPSITYITPQSGGVGTNVTIYGSGFTSTNNTVHFGNGIVTGLQSPDGQSLSFQVPSQLTGFGSQPVVVGTYNVSVTNSLNVSTNIVQFSVTSAYSGSAPTITSVSGPNNLTSGQQGTWTMQINTQGNTYTTVSASWGDTGNGYVNMAAPQTVYNSQTSSFTHTYFNPGTYTVIFTVSSTNGQTNSYTTTVNVSGTGGTNSGAPTISYLAPNSGHIGTMVTIYGSNFSTGNNNVIYFGSGAIQNVYSNGNSIIFTVPSYLTPYCQSGGYACPQYAQQVTPGSYNVSVMNPWGTSNTLTFIVN
ncbi:MAG: IPT/TIG domain-containing protein [Candidatus Pacebacteria bacterium]|nr:IPT/TIG domain-containing protein [Candidatus Paceibacterota bacterium]